MTFVLLSAPAFAESPGLRKYTIPQLTQLLESEGYGGVAPEEDDRIRFKAEGRVYYLYLYEDGDLQLYYGLTGVNLTAADINQWNASYRLTRAYLDTDKDPVLEADLLANAGINEPIITEFVKVFVELAARFRGFVVQHDRDEDKSGDVPAAPASSA